MTIAVATHVVSLPTGVGPSDGYDPSGVSSEIRTAGISSLLPVSPMLSTTLADHPDILSLHWGTEYRRMPDRYQTDLGPRLLSSPHIDLILGHHAHVVQPLDRIGDEYLVYGLGNFLSNQSPRWGAAKPGTQDGVILRFTVTEDPATGRWSVTSISHTPTRVNLTTFEIVNALNPKGEHNPAVPARSAAKTAEALAALGTAILAIPRPTPDPAEWLSRLLG